MLKLIAIGTLGYVAYRYIQRADRVAPANEGLRLAGGPLSSEATLQPTPDAPPPAAS